MVHELRLVLILCKIIDNVALLGKIWEEYIGKTKKKHYKVITLSPRVTKYSLCYINSMMYLNIRKNIIKVRRNNGSTL